jgi:hypothetical protein
VSLTGEGNEAIVTADAAGVTFRSGAIGSKVSRPVRGFVQAGGVAAADLNYDFRTDLVIGGAGGHVHPPAGIGRPVLRRHRRGRLPADIERSPAVAIWPADVDTDGDLDLVIARRGSPLLLRNNGDGTFAVRDPFAAIANARDFAWADLDGEGVPDAAFVDAAGTVHVC